MDRQPWFGRLTADQRAAVLLVTQRGVANFVAWLDEPAETIRLTAEAFRIAPRDLARRLTLRQTVELVRIATDVFEERLPPLAADEDERRVLVEGVLRFGRGIAFAAATAYAGCGRGPRDLGRTTGGAGRRRRRPRPRVTDGRGDDGDALVSRAAALGWEPSVTRARGRRRGAGPRGRPAEQLAELRRQGVRTGRPVLAALQGARLVVVRAEPADPGDPVGDGVDSSARRLRPGPRRRRAAAPPI